MFLEGGFNMMVFKRKQIVVLSLVLMIVVAGYLQYSYKKSSISVNGNETNKLGDAVYVDNQDQAEQTQKDAKDSKTPVAAASKQATDFFAQAKLDREITSGKDQEALKAITQDKSATKEVQTKAYDQMMKIVNNVEKEVRIETMIKEKGFNDVVALFGDDGSLDIVVKTPTLTSVQTTQIADVASRQANIPLENIHIKPMY
jgi:stage III sporulation protein AH